MPNLSEILGALQSTATTGMPEQRQGQQRPGHEINPLRLLRGGAVEQPSTHQPGLIDSLRQGTQENGAAPGLFSQGFSEVVDQTGAQLGAKVAGTAVGAILGGAVEQPDQEAIARNAAAAEKRRQAANTVLTTAAGLAASGIKGVGGLAARGILAGVNILRNKGKKAQSTHQPIVHTPQLNAENGDVINGEWKEV